MAPRRTKTRPDPTFEVQTHLAELDAEVMPTDTIPIPLNDGLTDEGRLAALRAEIETLTAKVDALRRRAVKSAKSGAEWADAQAHDRLGSYPWAKLAGAAVATVVATRLIRLIPFGGVAAVVAPLVIERLTERSRDHVGR